MPKSIRVALVNDYEIVLEGLRGLLRPYDPEIRVVELDVRRKPRRPVDVTLFDTYGEVQDLRQHVRGLASDATNGAIVVFSFSNDAAVATHFWLAVRKASSPRHYRRRRLSTASERPHMGRGSC